MVSQIPLTKRKDRNLPSFKDIFYKLHWQPEDMNKFVLRRTKKIVDYAFVNTEFYREEFKKVGYCPGELRKIEDLQHLPVLTKEKLREAIATKTIFSKDLDFKKLVAIPTTGSTGQPLTLYLDKSSAIKQNIIIARGFGLIGCKPSDRTLLLWRNKKTDKIGRIKSCFGLYKQIPVMDVMNITGSALTNEKLRDIAEEIRNFRPHTIRGYVSALYVLSRFVKMNNIQIKPKRIICCAEYLPHFIWDELKDVFKCQVINLYGGTEAPLVALSVDDVSKRMFLMDDIYWTEITNNNGKWAKTDEIGDMLITAYYLKFLPLIRYQVNDLAALDGAYHGPFRTLKEVYGRTNDIFVLSGNRVFFSHNWHIYFRDFPGLERFRVVQEDIDRITIQLLPYDKNLLCLNFDKLKASISNSIGNDVLINWNIVDSLPLDAGEKFRAVKSNIDWRKYV